MPRRILLFLSAIFLASALPAARPAFAQSNPTARLVTEFKIPNVTRQKFPSIATRNGIVHLAANNNEEDAFYWNKSETAADFGSPFRVGAAQGQGDYSTPALFVTPDNSVYYVWGSIEERLIKLRVRDPSGNWGPQRTVAADLPFAIFSRVAVAQGRIFVFWQDPDTRDNRPLFRTSNDGGATWSSTGTIGTEKTFSSMPGVAVGPNGEVAFVYSNVDYEINVALWNGSGFNIEEVTQFGYARPTISFSPDGTLYVAFGGIEDSGPLAASFYARRQAPGNWQVQKLADGKPFGNVNVVVDNNGHLHFAWVADVNRGLRVNYGVASTSGARSPIASSNTGDNFQAHLSVSDANTNLAHVASERFEGAVSVLQYLQFEGIVAPPVNAVPEIEGNNLPIRPKDSVSVAFTQVVGSPNEILWNWGAPPTDSDNDSGGWKPFANPMTIALPPPPRPIDCTPLVLFTKVRNGGNTQPGFSSDNVRFDGQVNVAKAATNPYMQRKAPIFTDAILQDLGVSGGASDGAPNYTRAPIFYMELRNRADCTGIKDVATGTSTSNLSTPTPIREGAFANIVPFPTIPNPGPFSVVVQVSDSLGNTDTYTPTFIYDTGAPVLTSPATVAFTTTVDPESTLLVDLNFNNLAVTDDFYPSPGYWGAWVANSRSVVQNPGTDANLLWTPVRISNGGTSAAISRWSLAAGLDSAEVTSGTYHVYVRFLDGAGNPSAAILTTSVSIDNVTRPEVYLPLIFR